jgi:hypothetical protein
VDEAYRLIPMQKSDDKDYGLEALEEIMSVMDSGKIVVIFAGYCEPMKRVIASNDGFCRRVTKFFYFEDFSTTELAEILHMKMNSLNDSSLLYGFKLHPSCSIDAIAELIARETSEERRKQMNGGLVDTLLANARENLDLRLDFNCDDVDTMIMITLEDLEAGLRQISRQHQLQWLANSRDIVKILMKTTIFHHSNIVGNSLSCIHSLLDWCCWTIEV